MDLGWSDYGARMYDPSMGRWNVVDPLAEDYDEWTPYNYTLSDPVNNIDPDGQSVWTKAAKVAVKVGAKVAKEGISSLKKGATWADAVSDLVDDAKTLTDSKASGLDRVLAAGSLLSEILPVSVNDAKDAYKAGKAVAGIIDNAGDAKKSVKKADEITKNASKYEDVKGSKVAVKNKQTDVTKSEFEKNLEGSGYNKAVSKDGKGSIYTKDGKKYVTREVSNSHDGPTADYTKSGSKNVDLKIRLKKDENE